jgi:hypothetical protein
VKIAIRRLTLQSVPGRSRRAGVGGAGVDDNGEAARQRWLRPETSGRWCVDVEKNGRGPAPAKSGVGGGACDGDDEFRQPANVKTSPRAKSLAVFVCDLWGRRWVARVFKGQRFSTDSWLEPVLKTSIL